MDAKQLGKRIRELRISKKMTQNEVVGDFITRNMLSKIESGAAVPSLQTLQHLSKALDVPISVIMPNEEDAVSLLNQCKQSLKDGNWQEVLRLLEQISSDFYDEAQAMGAQAHFKIARRLAESGEYRKAADHARVSLEQSRKGIYASKEIHAQALLLIDSISPNLYDTGSHTEKQK